MKNNKYSKNKILLTLTSFLVVLGLGVGLSLAFLVSNPGTVVNTLSPGNVRTEVMENFDKEIKKEVKIKNTGDVPAYIRSTFIVNWIDKDGNISSKAPVISEDYTLRLNDEPWLHHEGYYYHKEAVDPDNETEILIESIKPKVPKVGYSLSVEILGSGIQSLGMETDKTQAEAKKAIEAAWPDVKIGSDGKLVINTGNESEEGS